MPLPSNQVPHDCRDHFVSMNTRNADDLDPPLWCPVCGDAKQSGSIAHMIPSERVNLRAEIEKLRTELAEKTARIEKLVEIFDNAAPCNDSCDLGGILAWVDPAEALT